jgi:hypothetical protein
LYNKSQNATSTTIDRYMPSVSAFSATISARRPAGLLRRGKHKPTTQQPA